MKDDTHIPLEPVGDAELEARIVAWVLGEASSFEAAELERRCAETPELRLFERRMRLLHELIGENHKAPLDGATWRLADSKRSKITDLLGTSAAAEEMRRQRTVRYFTRRTLFAAAACLALSLIAWPVLVRHENEASRAPLEDPVSFLPPPGGSSLAGSSGRGEELAKSLRRNLPAEKEAVADQKNLFEANQPTRGMGNRGESEVTREPAGPAGAPSRSAREAKTELAAAAEKLALENGRSGARLRSQPAGAVGSPPPPPPPPSASPMTPAPVSRPAKPTAETALKNGVDTFYAEDKADRRTLADGAAALDFQQGGTREAGETAGGTAQEAPPLPAAPAAPIAPLAAADQAPPPAEPGGMPADPTPRYRLQPGDRAKLSDLDEDRGGVAQTKSENAGVEITGTFGRDLPLEVNGAGGSGGGVGGGAAADVKWPSRQPAGGPANGPAVGMEYRYSDEGDAKEAAAMFRKPEGLPWAGAQNGQRTDQVDGHGSLDAGNKRLGRAEVGFGMIDGATSGGRLGELPAKDQLFGSQAANADGKKSGASTGDGSEFFDDHLSTANAMARSSKPAARPAIDVEGRQKQQQGAAVGIPAVQTRTYDTPSDLLMDAEAAPIEEAQSATGLYGDLAQKEMTSRSKSAKLPKIDGELIQKAISEQGGDLEQAIRKQEEAVQDRRKTLSTIIRSSGTVYLGENSALGKGAHFDEATEANMAAEAYVKMEQDRIQLESQLQTLHDSSGAQQVNYAAGLDLPDNLVKTIHPQYLEAVRELDSLKKAGLGEHSPQVETQAKVVQGLKSALDEGVVNLRAVLKAKVDLSQEQLARLDQRRSLTKESAVTAGIANQEFAEARADFEQAQALLERLKQARQGSLPPKIEAQPPVVIPDQQETATAAEPFSTFSLHVSDASFKLAKAALERGERPAPDSVRPEEFYNAFDYGDPAPAHGEPVACVVGQAAHPVIPQRNLLRIGVRTGAQGRGGSTPLNLVLLLDSSGSMEREDRSSGLHQAVKQLAGLLKEGDTVTVAGFARQPHLLADRLPGRDAAKLNEIIARTPSEGGTNLEEGLKLAGELAARQFDPKAQNRVVLFTDGAANLGDAQPEALQKKIETLRQQGIAFDAAGFGADGLNDKLLERLTRNGNGRYYVVDRPEDADANFARQLAGAFRPAAENVKVQVRFNPARVARYKLLGFEEHRLQKEDFHNDAVDAAEMAAEEAGNALYQIETLPGGEGEVGEVSVRFRDAASGQMVERSWTIPYEAQAPAFDQAEPSLQLAGMAGLVAEKLRGGPLADAIDLGSFATPMARVKGRYADSPAVADLATMIEKLR